MLRHSLIGLLFFVFSCKVNKKDNLIFINDNFAVEFFQIADCNKLDTKTFKSKYSSKIKKSKNHFFIRTSRTRIH